MPLFNPGIDPTGGSISGNLSVGGTLAVAGAFSPADGVNTSGSAPAITPTFSSGVAAQLADTTRDYLVYFQVGTPGTGFSVAIGPTSTPANTIVGSTTPTGGEVFSFRLPAGWYVKWAGTATTLAAQVAIGC